jgi:hypothetical protein
MGERKDINVRQLDFRDWSSSVSAVRHAVVHNRGVVSPAQLKRLGPARAKLLAQQFPGRHRADGYRLKLDQKSAQRAIERFAEYAFHLYKEVSRSDGLDFKALKTGRIQT